MRTVVPMRQIAKPIVRILPPRLHHGVYRVYFQRKYPERHRAFQAARKETGENGECFRPFDEKKCIFVHVPKCAGISVARSLFGCDGGLHATVRQYQVIFPYREFQEYFKFTFVRNPWDRVVSAYFFLKQGGMTELDRRFAERHLSPYSDFDSFVREGLGSGPVRGFFHFRSQLEYLKDRRGGIPIDFIGYFENIQEDFAGIAHRLGVEAELKKENVTHKRKPYTEYYTPETIEIVGNLYREDIEALGYTFDNSTLAEQLKRRQIE